MAVVRQRRRRSEKIKEELEVYRKVIEMALKIILVILALVCCARSVAAGEEMMGHGNKKLLLYSPVP